MTSDDQFFFDYLASIPNDVKKYSAQVATSLDRHVDHAASTLRETLSQQSWLPASIRPPRRASSQFSYPDLPPRSMINSVQDWVSTHRAWTAAILAFVGTGGLLIYGNNKLTVKRRRARKAANGARKEIVVIAGSAHEPMTRSIASDLERRGFIVFVTVTSAEEEHVIQNEAREDIRSLWLDITNIPSTPSEIHPSLHVIQSLITKPQVPTPGMMPHICQLSGLILVPSLNYPTGPIATIPASSWADTINARLLYPILTTQLFLPLLTLKNNNNSIILISPSIQSSLAAPFASPEVTTTRALSGFATTLRQELRLMTSSNGGSGGLVEIIEVKVGNLDFGRQFKNGQRQNKGTEVLTWQPQHRALYGSPYLSSIDSRLGDTANRSQHGTPSRELHFAVFDALAPSKKSWLGRRKRKPHSVYVGRGSMAYSLIGKLVPTGVIGWMLGLRAGCGGVFLDSPFDDWNGSGSETGWEKVSES